ncbi:MAG: hypothetical protein HY074_20725 [Deltaproteobacteria bacterium]|nr:hypothetical protein [Deltaproteobacteria bacterium]
MKSSTRNRYREKFQQTGMNDYVSKPVKPAELFRVVELWLSQEAEKEKRPA